MSVTLVYTMLMVTVIPPRMEGVVFQPERGEQLGKGQRKPWN